MLSRRIVTRSALPAISSIQSRNASQRPISPHVTIYKFPLTAIASITHRTTGALLSVGKNTFCLSSHYTYISSQHFCIHIYI